MSTAQWKKKPALEAQQKSPTARINPYLDWLHLSGDIERAVALDSPPTVEAASAKPRLCLVGLEIDPTHEAMRKLSGKNNDELPGGIQLRSGGVAGKSRFGLVAVTVRQIDTLSALPGVVNVVPAFAARSSSDGGLPFGESLGKGDPPTPEPIKLDK